MSMEPNEPQQSTSTPPPASFTAAPDESSSTSQSAGAGNGQRRRRRRRKNRGGGARAGGATQAEGATEQAAPAGERTEASEPEVREAAPAPAANPSNAEGAGQFRQQGKRQREHGGQGGGGQGGGQFQGGGKKKHWQAKGGGQNGQGGAQGGGGQFSNNGSKENRPFQKQSREYNPGNSIYGAGNGGRRKNKKGRGPGSFVGPMDHSYRAPNGNIADGPADFRPQREVNGNVIGRNGYYDEWDHYMPVTAVREDAPVRIVMFVEDLFVVAKTQETARKLGIKVQFAKAEKETLQAIMDVEEDARPSLIVFDLNNAGAKPLTTIPKLKAKLKRGTSIIGFLSQIQGDLKVKATEAGCDMVMHKGAFSQNLPHLLRRHGIEDEEFETVEA